MIDIKLPNSSELQKDNSDINILSKIATGRAVLFTGAGFSIYSQNNTNKLPLAKTLSHKICEKGGFALDDDLAYAAEYYINNNNVQDLIDILKSEFTITSVSEEQKNICKLNWLSYYTTNYDRSIEISCQSLDIPIQSVSAYSTINSNPRIKKCLHINGDIDSLNHNSFEKEFKLTKSSYAISDQFSNSAWYKKFKIDLERSSAIVFVGYSLYDIAIQNLLIENQNLKNKTFFIVDKDAGEKERFILQKYGNILPIGISGFSKLISANYEMLHSAKSQHEFLNVSFPNISNEINNIEDKDVENFLTFGQLESHYIDSAVTIIESQIIPYLIIRKELLEHIYYLINKANNVLILGGFGNGKTILMKQLVPYLLVKGLNIIKFDNLVDDYIEDIEELSKQGKNFIALIDDYPLYLEIIKYCQEFKVNNIRFILSAREADHYIYQSHLQEINLDCQEVYINELSDDEIDFFIEIINNLSWKGILSNPSHRNKQKFIKETHKAQLSLSLLGIFDSANIKNKIRVLLEDLVKDLDSKKTIFSILLLNIMNVPPSFATISDIADNECIYNHEFSNNSAFKQLFKINGLKVDATSSVFCIYLIQNYFKPVYISQELLAIAKNFNVPIGGKRSQKEDIIFKSVLRFSFVERIFPNANKRNTLENYYRELKVQVPWLQKDPHFWLQYGMSCITYKDYHRAQDYLNESYALAKNKNEYHTKNIDNQQARLYLLQAIDKTIDIKDFFTFFQKAHNLLLGSDNDDYKLRQVFLYKKYYASCFNNLSNNNKKNFVILCKNMLNSIEMSDQGRFRYRPSHEVLTSIINENS